MKTVRECACGDHAFVETTRGFITLVSPEDAHLLDRSWHASPRRNGRVCYADGWNKERRSTISLHRMVMGFPLKPVDHINRNGMDNRRSNLRICTPSQNVANGSATRNKSSRFKGVHYSQAENRWIAVVTQNGRPVFRKRFKSEADAASAYDMAARELFGEFATTNQCLGIMP